MRIRIGKAEISSCRNTDCCFGGSPRNLTPCCCSVPIKALLLVSGLYVTNDSPDERRLPSMISPLRVTESTLLLFTSDRNCE